MKLLIALAVAGLLCVPAFAGEREDRIAEIKEQIAELQAELRELEGDARTVTGDNVIFSIDEAFYPEELHIAVSNMEIVPDEGKRFLVIKVGIYNQTEESRYVDYCDFLAYIDNHSIELTDKCGLVDKYDMISDSVLPERQLDGYLIYEVPEDWDVIEIAYPDDFGDYITLSISPIDISA